METVSFILITLTLVFKMIIVCSGQCLDDQSSLLLHFKHNLSFSPLAYFSFPYNSFKPISFSPTGRLSSWNSSTDCCSWDGVTCDEMSGNVIGLDLTNQSISGGIYNSSALFHLQHLHTLNLAFNPFDPPTPIPSGFHRLTKLTHLNLSMTFFTGQIPIEISHIKTLVSLDLSTVEFFYSKTGNLKLEKPNLKELVGNMSNLRVLVLDGVDLSTNGSEWWRAVSALPKLQVLSLQDCGLTGPFDPSLSSLNSLMELRLGRNNLKVEKPNLNELVGNMSNLRVLVLDGVDISTNGSEWCRVVSALPKLQVLSLRMCSLTGPFDPSLSSLNSLMELRLTSNNLSSHVPEFFGSFSNLTVLHLSDCGLHGTFPERVFHIQSLVHIVLASNELLQVSLPEFPQNGSLVSLGLSETNFSGSLPFSISNLKFLSYLDLYKCGFNGSIPLSISNLSRFQVLDISFNNLTGVIPSTILALPLLSSLDLSHNMLTGEIPSGIFALPNLQILYLSENNLSGEIPSWIYALPNLESLDLSWNNLSGNLDMFQKFEHLESLMLSGNDLTMKMDNSLSWFSQLSQLRLSSCNLKAIPGFLRNQSQLRDLDISNNHIHGKIPNWFFNTTSATRLDLSHNFLEGVQLGPQGKMDTIDLSSNLLQGPLSRLPLSVQTSLDYSKNNIASIIPNNIGSYLSNASFLSFSSNRLNGEIPASICDANKLSLLDLSNNSLSGRIPLCLGSMTSLIVLKLKGNHFHGTIPNTFLSGCQLQTLDLNGNKIEGEMPKSLKHCTSLEVIDVGKNQLNDKFPSWLNNLSQLRVIVMRSNNFHGCIGHPENNYTFPMLQIIDLSSNNFTCNLPTKYIMGWKAMQFHNEEDDSVLGSRVNGTGVFYQDSVTITIKGSEIEMVKILTVYISIDLSNNNFIGEIPAVIGDLVLLKSLNFSCNALTGPIPESFGKLKQLESLDLSRNKLGGEIPNSLSDLTFLGVLKLAFNQFTGAIPIGRQLQTFTEDSFEGNEGLCGLPLSKKCKNDVSEPPTPNFNNEDDSDDDEPNWLIIITSLGFGVGNGVAICMIVFCRPLNRWYRRLQFGLGR